MYLHIHIQYNEINVKLGGANKSLTSLRDIVGNKELLKIVFKYFFNDTISASFYMNYSFYRTQPFNPDVRTITHKHMRFVEVHSIVIIIF